MDHTSPISEAGTSSKLEPRCRLCLQWTDEENGANCGLADIFTDDDDSLLLRIQDCLGVVVSPEDSIRTICTNCRQMVSLFDEFRTLCRQTKEIYASVRIRCEDSERWRRFGEYVGELRKLGQEHKDMIDKQLSVVEDVEGAAEEDSQNVAPMLLVKEEPKEDGEAWDEYLLDVEPNQLRIDASAEEAEWDDELMDVKSDRLSTDEHNEEAEWGDDFLDIKPDSLPTVESEEAADANIEGEPPEDFSSTSYDQQVKLAQETLKQLKRFNSDLLNNEQLWAEIAEQVGIKYSTVGTLWKRMKQSYLANKAAAATGNRRTILRLQSCALFNLMNQIVPELDGNVEPWVASKVLDTTTPKDGYVQGKTRLPISMKVAIAEEVKKHPQLWRRSLRVSTDPIWKSIAGKLKLDVRILRVQWSLLKNIYRNLKKRMREGSNIRCKVNPQFYRLIEIMHHIYQIKEGKPVKQEQEAEQGMTEGRKKNLWLLLKADQATAEGSKEKAKRKRDSQMTLAKLVYEHQHLWDLDHPEYRNGKKTRATWNRIAVMLNKTFAEVKYDWKQLRDMYRSKVKRHKQGMKRRSTEVPEPLFKLMDLMCAKNMHFNPDEVPDVKRKTVSCKTEWIPEAPPATEPLATTSNVSTQKSDESDSDDDEDGATVDNESEQNTRMKLAGLCEKHEIIWNSNHPDHVNWQKRNIAWDFIAQKMNFTREQTKAVWTRMRHMYRRRRMRLLSGNFTENDRLIRDPLYQKLNAMLVGNMHVGKYSGRNSRTGASIETQEADDPRSFFTVEEKIRLVEEMIKHEVLWNTTHPDFNNAILRAKIWKRIAVTLNQSSKRIKQAYRLLRSSYRSRFKRIKQNKTDPELYCEFDPLFRNMHLMFSKSMQNNSQLKAVSSGNSADMADEPEEHEDMAEHDIEKHLKLVGLCEKNELIWNSKHPSYTHLDERDAAWDSIAQEMNQSKAHVKKLWIRLRNIYRSRRIRYLRGSYTRKNYLLCDPLYQKLHAMLQSHMQLGKHGGWYPKKDVPEEEPTGAGPFSTMENKVRLVEEVFKQELLWNTTHVDYFKSDKRGEMWTHITGLFDNCDASVAKSEWRRLRNLHRPRESRALPIYDKQDDEPQSSQPLDELFSKMAESLTAENQDDPDEDGDKVGESSGVTDVNNVKRRIHEEIPPCKLKRKFGDDGCMKVNERGIDRYKKICELCGKQIARSVFEYHMNQHKGLTPYVCSNEICGRQFSNKNIRDRHEKRHLPEALSRKQYFT